MNTFRLPPLALCLAALLLSACGGGGSAVVRTSPPPVTPPPPPPPPPPSSAEPCASPVTADCLVEPRYTLAWDENRMTGGRQSDHALIVYGTDDTYLSLVQGEYRFGGGTDVAGGTLVVRDGGVLVSDVEIYNQSFAPGGTLWLSGTIRGNVLNHGALTTRHTCRTSGHVVCVEDARSRIEGDYAQDPTALLQLVLGWDLQITGRARLDGSLSLIAGTSQSYVLPNTATSVLLLRAGGGVSGRFDTWVSPGLFLEGTLRYTPDAVYFDLTRISLASAIANAGVRQHATLAGAAQLDRAFAVADAYADDAAATLTPVQRRFLASSASIQRIGDVTQAVRTFDSLGGALHARIPAALDQRIGLHNAQLAQRLDRVAPGTQLDGWTSVSADTVTQGHDVWLTPRRLVGARVSSEPLAFGTPTARMAGDSVAADVFAHVRNEEGGYATGIAGFRQSRMDATRALDLADAGVHQAVSRRVFQQAYAALEVGRRWSGRWGHLSPFAGLDVVATQADRFQESGGSGFELIAGDASSTAWTASLGARYARAWAADRVWLVVDARYRHAVGPGRTPQRAAFAGAPSASFDLHSPDGADGIGDLRLGLVVDLDHGWRGSFDHARGFGSGLFADPVWTLGLQRRY